VLVRPGSRFKVTKKETQFVMHITDHMTHSM
jgi:hypothetical protein